MKPKLFMDIDGVVYAHYAGEWQVRPYLQTLLGWAEQHFDIFWASYNMRREMIVQVTYSPGTVCVDVKPDSTAPHGKLRWLEAYGAFDGHWFLIEDTPPCEEERKFLVQRGWLDRWIVVPDTGGDVLLDVKKMLEGWLKGGKLYVPFDWCRPQGIGRTLCTIEEWRGYTWGYKWDEEKEKDPCSTPTN